MGEVGRDMNSTYVGKTHSNSDFADLLHGSLWKGKVLSTLEEDASDRTSKPARGRGCMPVCWGHPLSDLSLRTRVEPYPQEFRISFLFSKIFCIVDFFSKTMNLPRGYRQFEYLDAEEVLLFNLGFLSLGLGLVTCRT